MINNKNFFKVENLLNENNQLKKTIDELIVERDVNTKKFIFDRLQKYNINICYYHKFY
jgi:hypothetical protein